MSHVPDALLWVVGDRGQVNLAQALARQSRPRQAPTARSVPAG
jgi:hypothetical protein